MTRGIYGLIICWVKHHFLFFLFLFLSLSHVGFICQPKLSQWEMLENYSIIPSFPSPSPCNVTNLSISLPPLPRTESYCTCPVWKLFPIFVHPLPWDIKFFSKFTHPLGGEGPELSTIFNSQVHYWFMEGNGYVICSLLQNQFLSPLTDRFYTKESCLLPSLGHN